MKTALVTGGSRGIGLGIVEQLLKNDYQVAINGVRDQKNVQPLIDSLNINGVRVVYFQGNIGNKSDRQRIVEDIQQKLGPIHVLVNNAGVAPKKRKDILEIDEDSYDFVMDINLKGTFFLSQLVAKSMIESKIHYPKDSFCIINITSISASVASISRGEYCISKAGASMLTKLFAVRMAAVGIPVYEIQPGIIRTDMTAAVQEKYEQLIKDGLTLDKRLGIPQDIGKIVSTLVHGDLPYATGQIITADGGLMIRRL
jgi:NAD(P)-dependent dehydrogenase (short-subunit alcohol dehydrogenase family)|tara:strand:- start:303 stop:1070 length:768 start_codon:yes stop_codon:yes gene_type:complete